ncbi:uncharacterized protein LOC113552613 [Rhopalosiphum maidis]|uniref:uncharacterized protein LOC113552613 n=1 Tax=Rhopalosiphum maidis TaxID=43146 RepID=UPI000EFE6BF8|nr:uncharacterized protein LOC113552613 [Rhopalosiphum maidis]
MDSDKLEDNDERLDAYLDFMYNATELISIEEDIDEKELDKSLDIDDKYEIFDRAFKKIGDDTINKPLYKSIKVDIKKLSFTKHQLLVRGRQEIYEKNLNQDIYSSTMENRADNEMSDAKVERLSFKYVWEEIRNLKSTKAFCEHLKDNPDLEKPKYLVDIGFFDNNYNTSNNKRKSLAIHEKHTRL